MSFIEFELASKNKKDEEFRLRELNEIFAKKQSILNNTYKKRVSNQEKLINDLYQTVVNKFLLCHFQIFLLQCYWFPFWLMYFCVLFKGEKFKFAVIFSYLKMEVDWCLIKFLFDLENSKQHKISLLQVQRARSKKLNADLRFQRRAY